MNPKKTLHKLLLQEDKELSAKALELLSKAEEYEGIKDLLLKGSHNSKSLERSL